MYFWWEPLPLAKKRELCSHEKKPLVRTPERALEMGLSAHQDGQRGACPRVHQMMRIESNFNAKGAVLPFSAFHYFSSLWSFYRSIITREVWRSIILICVLIEEVEAMTGLINRHLSYKMPCENNTQKMRSMIFMAFWVSSSQVSSCSPKEGSPF